MYVPNKKRVRHSKLLAFWAVVLCVASLSSIGFASWVTVSSEGTPNINVEVGDTKDYGQYLTLNTNHGNSGFISFSYYETGILQNKNTDRTYTSSPYLSVYMLLNLSEFELESLSKISMTCTFSSNDTELNSKVKMHTYSYFYSKSPGAAEFASDSSSSNYEKNNEWTKYHSEDSTSTILSFDLENLDDGGAYDWSEMNYTYIKVTYTFNISKITASPLNIKYNFAILPENS